MNERIRELADQAENYAAEQNDKFGVSYKKTYNQKFAELIVAECAGYVIGAAEVYTQEEQDACERAAVGLMNYFGVEE